MIMMTVSTTNHNHANTASNRNNMPFPRTQP